ncbi:tripartite tricarboxylate transporter permease [Nocardiopsis sp. HNM0947]|uniref:Tripartite tricarboxylate transporter permease n=1 Tax=Nocardiopsis coralli TaxID=2772213 RepID=A0ABR9PBG6_9ACTN|nr:tripartite tricarboxylate transporter permease [Nocardiopsis coralli]MBE3001173.1 tripartite tricarboxylate transporter permease [Nocardiopsis coralli]
MLDAALTALSGFLDPWMLVTLLIGVLAGLVLGLIPGLGGTGAVAVLLPFIFLLEPQQALALVIGATAVIHTADTISTVLLGVPGSASSSVLLLDGHTMARKGQASRALSIAFVSSAVGGLVGAFGLTVSIAVAQPLVMAFASPELFMLTVLGISLAALMSRGNVTKGLLAASLGLLLGQVGMAPASAEYRYTFGSLFLAEGLDLVAVALGVFGLAEIMSLVARRTSVAQRVELRGGWGQGIRDVFRHWTHVLRGSFVGIWAGIIPGVGATAGSWLAYGQAAATVKDKKRFGKGDPRGVAAPEGASTSISAGDLIPTLLFGIPGSAAAALLLGALLVFGIEPGPSLITEDLDLVYTIVWSFAIAAIMGAALCFLLAGPLAKLSFVRFPILAAGLIVVMFVASFQASQEFGVLQVMLLLGVVGWLMKYCDYPRAPFLIGFVLSIPLERYFFLTDSLYGTGEWMTRPAVLVMAALLLSPLVFKAVRRVRSGSGGTSEPSEPRETVTVGGGTGHGSSGTADGSGSTDGPGSAGGTGEAGGPEGTPGSREGGDADTDDAQGADEPEGGPPQTGPDLRGSWWPLGTALLFAVVFAAALLTGQTFTESGKLVPQLVGTVGLALSLAVCVQEWRRLKASAGPAPGLRRELGWTLYAFGWLCLFLALIYVAGTVLATAVFVPVFLRVVAQLRTRGIVVYTVALIAVLLTLQLAADIALPQGWIMPAFLL